MRPGAGHKLVAAKRASYQSRSAVSPANCRSGQDSKIISFQQMKPAAIACFKNDYSNHYIHSGVLPVRYIRNAKQQVDGYPKLQRLYRMKEQQVKKYATRPFGARVKTDDFVSTLNSWVYDYHLQFDVIMIGALSENQLLYPIVSKLPIDKLCAKPGFLFIWASTQKISELSKLLNDPNSWCRRFRRSEELIFVPIDKDSPYYPTDSNIPEKQILEEIQWHCWMCITGTVRRSTDKELIHCNINTDLAIENEDTGSSAVPAQIYKVAENFSNSTRRLHIIPAATGPDHPVRVRPGWVIVSPDVILDNFNPERYQRELGTVGHRIPLDNDIEQLRPKTPN
ncbi:DEKNAAC105522 [Brettanomyces naardenensis]|uniref:DEKNAAC105522 n=1 Tax=Brettanomyces naardenensis TaxID=13370 RepID=A0A448YTU3_BRENA|nr:DEKNAAC105522 [Brettanomyces naardenensis]